MKLTNEQILERKIWRQFSQGLMRYELIADGDRILIGLSGGKDSLALLEFMARRAKIYKPHIEIAALHVRMKNIDYESDITYLTNFANRINVPFYVCETSFESRSDKQKSPCFLCSWNRRKKFFEVANRLKYNKIALGHHQDDILQTMWLNLCFQGQFATMPARLKMRKFPLTIIRPFCMVHETDLKDFAKKRGYIPQRKLCPYESCSNRSKASMLFVEMEKLNPEVRYSMWNALESSGKLVE